MQANRGWKSVRLMPARVVRWCGVVERRFRENGETAGVSGTLRAGRTEEIRDTGEQPFPRGSVFQGAGPDGDDVPAEVLEGGFGAEIAGLVAGDLVGPPFGAGAGKAEVGAVFVAVPEAAVDEDDGAEFRQDEIGAAGEGFVFRAVHGEAVAETVEHGPEGELGFGVPAADAGHDVGAFFGSENVGHGGGKLAFLREAGKEREDRRGWGDRSRKSGGIGLRNQPAGFSEHDPETNTSGLNAVSW